MDSSRPTWFQLGAPLRLGLTALVVSGLLSACAPAPQPAATAAAAKPADAAAKPADAAAAKPADAAAKPAASPVAAGQPAAKPSGPARGSIVIVNESEPDTIVPKDASTNISYFVLDNVYDHLTARDYSSGEVKWS